MNAKPVLKRSAAALALCLFLTLLPPLAAAEEPNFANMLEDFEAAFTASNGYGELPPGWTAEGSAAITCQRGQNAHDGSGALQAQGGYDDQYTVIRRSFTGTPGAKVKLRLQAIVDTGSWDYAEMGLGVVLPDGGVRTAMHLWYRDNALAWVSITMEDAVVPDSGELVVFIKMGHGTYPDGATSIFYADSLTCDTALAPAGADPGQDQQEGSLPAQEEQGGGSGDGGGGGGCFLSTLEG